MHGVLGALAPLSHILIYSLELMAARGFAVCWVCLHPSRTVSCIFFGSGASRVYGVLGALAPLLHVLSFTGWH